MISEIVRLKRDGLSIKQIAEELDTSIGKVQYRWNKYRQTQEETEVENNNKRKACESVAREQDSINASIDQCVLMAQSPNTLYCYWELSETKRTMIEHQLNTPWSNIDKKLRIYDITGKYFNGHNANRYFDYSLPEICDQWFLYDLSPNTTFCVDIGVITKEGSFLSLVRSNAIDTPRFTSEANGLHCESVMKWKSGQLSEPEWLEGFSSYSYYQKIK
ncbi:MAG: DUF4912 domain-containing protein [Bacillaceae bacterium]|nr:DUF4912 domain-containing protein [Bacillaceae bacterium]